MGVSVRSLLRTAVAVLALVAAARLVGAGESATQAIGGEITGGSGRYPIRVTLWDRAGFLRKPVQELKLEPGRTVRYSFKVTPGSWAVSAFEDRNGNGTLDIGMFGPKEPTGFWRLFAKWRQPEFDEVAIVIEGDREKENIALK